MQDMFDGQQEFERSSGFSSRVVRDSQVQRSTGGGRRTVRGRSMQHAEYSATQATAVTCHTGMLGTSHLQTSHAAL